MSAVVAVVAIVANTKQGSWACLLSVVVALLMCHRLAAACSELVLARERLGPGWRLIELTKTGI